MEEPPSWWLEFWSLYWGCTGGFDEIKVQELAKRQAVIFRLPVTQDEESGWWNPTPSLSVLGHKDFLLHWDFYGTWNIQEARKEQTLVLAKALQCCTEQAGGPSIMMCHVARVLHRCMAHLMGIKEEDVLEIPPLKPMCADSTVSPTPSEDATLLEEPQAAGG